MLRNAKALCDRLIVGVSTDELVSEYKNKTPIVPFDERCEILRNISCVDVVIAQETGNKYEVWQKIRFDIMFVGDDWHMVPKWEHLQKQFADVGVRIVYFPYTKSTSSTMINDIIAERRKSIIPIDSDTYG